MAKAHLSENMRELPIAAARMPQRPGPFVTISREFGCHGVPLGLLLLDIFNESVASGKSWQIYHKDILDRLARETNTAGEIIEREMSAKPSLLVDFFRTFSRERIPSGYEIRNRITTLIRYLAIQGRAIIIGQGGAAATQDLPNGLSIRLEAPEEWRVRQVAIREGVNEAEARRMIREVEAERAYLRKIYELRFPRKPAFNLVYDCSVFTLAQIAQHVACMMKLKGCLK